MIEVSIQNSLRIAEVPITYYPRPKGSEPNLHSFSDGWRHLKHILLRAPTLLFLIPGSILFLLGISLVFLIWNPFNFWEQMHGIHSMIAGCLLAIVGYQVFFLGLFAKTYGAHHGLEKRDKLTEFISKHITLARGATVGLMIFLAGFVYTLHLLLDWIADDILFVLFECDWWRGWMKCKLEMAKCKVQIILVKSIYMYYCII